MLKQSSTKVGEEMKVLLVGLRVGAGLISICNSVKQELDSYPNISTNYVDIYAKNEKRAKFSSEFYYKLVKFFPSIVALGQKIAYNQCLKTKENFTYLKTDIKLSKAELINYIQEYEPDIIFTPLNFVALALDELIEEGKTNVKYIFQMPDFMIAYYSQNLKHCTYLCSSCQEVTEELLKLNFDKNKLKTIGIPINPKFLTNSTKEEILNKLNYPDKRYILLSNGGAGFGNNYKIIKYFSKEMPEFGFIVVNGKNTKSKEKIDKFIKKNNLNNVINLGFVDYMPDLMQISEIMIGKCGSSTLCEASVKELKYIALNNNLFPEIKNIEFIIDRNSALIAKNIRDIKKNIDFYLNNQDSGQILENFKSISNKNASKEISQLIISAYEK